MNREPPTPAREFNTTPTIQDARAHRAVRARQKTRTGWFAPGRWAAAAMVHGRALLTPARWRGNLPASSATLNAQLWADAVPWRLTAGWVVLAALLAGGALQQWQTLDSKGVLLLWLLADLLWGALWRLAGGRAAILGLGAGAGDGALHLPYMQSASPAAQLLSLDERNSLPYLVRVALPTLLVIVVVAATLGVSALVYTAALIIITVAGWILRRTLQTPPLLLHAVAMVALPWLLTLNQIGTTPLSAVWPAAIALGALWTLHAWGEARNAVWQPPLQPPAGPLTEAFGHTWQIAQSDRLALWLMGGAQIGLLLLLVVNKTPVWAPIVAILLLPTWLRTLRKLPLAGLSGWWMAAFLVSALALGWR